MPQAQSAVVYEYIYRLQEEGGAGVTSGLCQLLLLDCLEEHFGGRKTDFLASYAIKNTFCSFNEQRTHYSSSLLLLLFVDRLEKRCKVSFFLS